MIKKLKLLVKYRTIKQQEKTQKIPFLKTNWVNWILITQSTKTQKSCKIQILTPPKGLLIISNQI